MRRRQLGLSMMELMIAMLLSSIVIYGAISMFMASRGTSQTTVAVGDITDTGRVALDMMGESLRSSGTMACSSVNATKQSYSSFLPPPATMQEDYGNALDGFEAAGTAPGDTVTIAAMPVAADPASSDWTAPSGSLDALLIGSVIKNSDVVAMRGGVAEATPAYTTADYTPGQLLLTLSSVVGFHSNENVVVSSCGAAYSFQIGTVNNAAMTISTDGPQTQSGGNLGTRIPQYSLVAPVHMAVYYIGVGRDGDSSLFRYDDWTGLFQELVPDVENMQVLYGLESSPGSRRVAEYVTADQVPSFNLVGNVRIGLLVASPPGSSAVSRPLAAPSYKVLGTTVTAPIDQRLRKVIETTITVENAAL